MKKKKLYKTVIRFEIISDEPIAKNQSLSSIDEMTDTGHCLGRFLQSETFNEKVTGQDAVKAVKDMGSDTDFFQMDEKGNELEEEI